ncbi:hypothetical protein PENTCL1PPCAC_22533, partial [Pristionchus entomophagus]
AFFSFFLSAPSPPQLLLTSATVSLGHSPTSVGAISFFFNPGPPALGAVTFFPPPHRATKVTDEMKAMRAMNASNMKPATL